MKALKQEFPRFLSDLNKSREWLNDWNEIYQLDHQNQTRWVALNAKPERFPDGSIAWRCVLTDETLRVESERMAADASQRLTLATRTARIGIWELDIATKYLFWDAGMFDLYGINQEDFHHRIEDFEALVHTDDIPHTRAFFEEAKRTGVSVSRVFRIRRPNGEIRHMLASGKMFFDERDSPIRFLGINYDVTDQKRAEVDLIESKNEAERINAELQNAILSAKRSAEEAQIANHAKSAFLASMSHEIRTPLNAVLGMASLLAETSLDHEQSSFIQTIKTSSQSLLNIINDILDYSKIEAGKTELDKHPFQLLDTIDSSFSLVSEAASLKQLDLTYSIDFDLPDLVVGDSLRVRQILVNLLSNAVKFTKSGHVKLGCDLIDLDEDMIRVCIYVEDTGIGIPKEKQLELFQTFSQIDSSFTRRFGGTGLGLAISKRLAELMGGSIQVQSDEGRGSRFSVTLEFETDPSALSLRHAMPADAIGDIRCSIIDASEATRENLEESFAQWSVESAWFDDQRAWFDCPTQLGNSDLIIIDQKNTRASAERLALKLKEHYPSIPLVVICSIGLRSKSDIWHTVFNLPIQKRKLHSLLSKCAARSSDLVREKDFHFQIDSRPQVATKHPLKILIVEDNRTNAMVLSTMLKKMGYSADIAHNGIQALNLFETNSYDLILLDIQMPGIDGLETAKRIRAKAKEIRPWIIAISAIYIPRTDQELKERGLNDYLSKPLQIQHLEKAVIRASKELKDILS